MKRNQNIEMLRGVAILMILFYHYTISVPGMVKGSFGLILDESICQVAMCLFFSISGFGTYIYLDKQTENVTAWEYLKKRFRRIARQYYFCIGVILLTTGASYLAWNQSFKILSVLTFCQNLFYSTNGAINGVSWTVALMMQFYVVAVPLYKLVKKYGIKSYVVSAILVLFIRIVISYYILLHSLDLLNYVIYSIRQIFTTADIFIAGMFAAKIYKSGKLKLSSRNGWAATIGSGIGAILTFVIFTYTPQAIYVWGSNLRCWLWQPLVGLETAVMLLCACSIQCKYKTLIGKSIQFVARNEYGIYLWHMILFRNLSQQSPMYAGMLSRSPILLLSLMIVLAIIVGAISNSLIRG